MKETSIWGTPFGAGIIPSRWKRPKILLSFAIGLSPWSTTISTEGWLSIAVENISVFFVGIVVFASTNLVHTPPIVSIPSERGITSRRTTSPIELSPAIIAPWIAAPIATASSGFRDLLGALPKNFSTARWIAGILVEPPTSRTSSISLTVIPAFLIADLQGSIVLFTILSIIFSNTDLESVLTKCTGTPSIAVIYGRLMSVVVVLDNSILARSAASFNLCIAIGSFDKSKLELSFLNSSIIQLIIHWSISLPPRWVSPSVARTSNTPSPNSRIVTSCVPPP